MGASKRMSFQIMAEMLNFCKEPQIKTHVMQRTNLSYAGVEKYLHQLIDLGLLESQQCSASYSTTERGFAFLNKWAQLGQFTNLDNRLALLELRLLGASAP